MSWSWSNARSRAGTRRRLTRSTPSHALALTLFGALACSTGESGTMGVMTTQPTGLTHDSADTMDTGEGRCGDGVVEAGEECDQGEKNSVSGLCTPECTLAACGDGHVYPAAEECDEGEDNAEDAGCLPTCAKNTCGDGFLYAGVEACDDGNKVEHDGCTAECQIDLCGDGKVDFGEACDDGNQSDTDACLPTCVAATCGDGLVHAGVEECDDGPKNADDAACLSTCEAAACGDGLVHAGEEECDAGPGNAEDGACLPTCELASCGDGFVQAGVEECDDGNVIAGDGCDASCTIELACGQTFTTTWCLQTGTKGQYTRCESVSDQGTTCHNPEIRYGNVTGGIPRLHNESDTYHPIWCQQLGFTGYAGEVSSGLRACDAPKGGLFPCTGYDEVTWKWCDWEDGKWYNGTLDWHLCDGKEITSITCTK